MAEAKVSEEGRALFRESIAADAARGSPTEDLGDWTEEAEDILLSKGNPALSAIATFDW